MPANFFACIRCDAHLTDLGMRKGLKPGCTHPQCSGSGRNNTSMNVSTNQSHIARRSGGRSLTQTQLVDSHETLIQELGTWSNPRAHEHLDHIHTCMPTYIHWSIHVYACSSTSLPSWCCIEFQWHPIKDALSSSKEKNSLWQHSHPSFNAFRYTHCVLLT